MRRKSKTSKRLFGSAVIALTTLVGSSVAGAHSSKRTLQSGNIMWDPDTTGMSGPTGGASFLIRERNEIWLEGYGAGLDETSSYTVWLVVFNFPQHCTDGCGLDDLATPRVRPSIVWGTGFITDAQGQGHFNAHLGRRNPLGEALEIPDTAVHTKGLLSGRGTEAEIHFIIRSHGPVDPGQAALQISTFGGGCEDAPEGECKDVQFGVFLP